MINLLKISLSTCFLIFASCKSNQRSDVTSSKEVSQKSQSQHQRVVETVATGLEVPWSIVFTPDKRILVTERAGRIRVIENDKLKAAPLAVLNDVVAEVESGLLGMTIHPDFAHNKFIYVCYTTRDKDGLKERVKRFRESAEGLVDEKIIIDNMPAAPTHDGCRIKFGPDKKLYITTGESGKPELAQKLDSLGGKTLRLNDDGSVPKDNPFVGQKNARPEIWSYGHRNAQGLDWQPGTGIMFQSEHGPSGNDAPGGGDEINIVMRGKNYGWPIIHHKMTKEGMESPLLEYTPALAPSGATFYTSKNIPEWTNNFFFACLRGKRIVRVVLEGSKVVKTEDLYKDTYGRIRDVAQGPDGALYFATSNRDGRGQPAASDDRIMRIR